MILRHFLKKMLHVTKFLKKQAFVTLLHRVLQPKPLKIKDS
nr:MAG TPA: hypothetical protein [Caudoviricetes sp.]